MDNKMQDYRKKNVQPMEPWTPDVDMEGVSVSEPDIANGSPLAGDMIAINPADPSDRWLVSADFFVTNYESAVPAPTGTALERVKVELEELFIRLEALKGFKGGEVYTGLSKTDQRNLRLQLVHMEDYAAILTKRIQVWAD
jgi:hypothetical protein